MAFLAKTDLLPGGKAKGKTNADLRAMGVSQKEIEEGRKVEMEHTTSPKVADEIQRDHHMEDKQYYKKLKKIEGAEKSLPFYLDDDEAMKGIFGKPRQVKTFTAHEPPGAGGGKIATTPHGTYHAVKNPGAPPERAHAIQFRPHPGSKAPGGIVGHAPAQGPQAIRMARGHHNQFGGGTGRLKLKSLEEEMEKSSLKQRRAARKKYEKAKGKPLGEGSRFAAVEASARAGGAKDPAAVAAAIGRKKHGAKKMAHMAAAGRKSLPFYLDDESTVAKGEVPEGVKAEEPTLQKSYWACPGYDGCFDNMVIGGE